jgi:hypothetical protein
MSGCRRSSVSERCSKAHRAPHAACAAQGNLPLRGKRNGRAEIALVDAAILRSATAVELAVLAQNGASTTGRASYIEGGLVDGLSWSDTERLNELVDEERD